MERLDPVVAEVSPNIYAAAKQANLKAAERLQLEQLSFALKEHRKLGKLSEDKAKNEFRSLGKDQQESLRTLFKDAKYAQEDPSIGDYAKGFGKEVLKTLASPLVELYNVAYKYGRAINTPYLVGQQVKTGQGSILDKKVWSRAASGKELYNPDALKKAEDTFGVTDVLVARGLLSGKKPGEIVESYGKVDSAILASLTKAYNDEKAFKQVLDATKYAQFSPGRDLARILDDKPPANGGVHGDYVSGKTKDLSGRVDFLYQIIVDPLTYITGGTTKAGNLVSLAAQLCDNKEKVVSQISFRIQPSHIPFDIPKEASDIHGITTEEAESTGVPMKLALEVFSELLGRADTLIAHNTAFDLQIIERAFNVFHMKFKKPNNIFCTMMMAKDQMKLQGKYKDYKFPKLQECHEFFFNVGYHDWHDALTDVNVCRMIYFHMMNLKIENVSPREIPNELLKKIEGEKYKNLTNFLKSMDTTKLNTWELEFCNSVIEKLNNSEEHILLSNKQHQVLVNIHKKHGQ